MKSLFAVLFAASLSSEDIPSLSDGTSKEASSTEITATTTIQKDQQATNILNAVTTTTKSRKTIALNFRFTVKNGDMKEVQKGDLKIKDNKYCIQFLVPPR